MNLKSFFFILFLGLTVGSSNISATSETRERIGSCCRCDKDYSKDCIELVLIHYKKYKDNHGRPKTSITIACEHTMCVTCHKSLQSTFRDCHWCHADWEHTSAMIPASALWLIAPYGDARSLKIALDALPLRKRASLQSFYFE